MAELLLPLLGSVAGKAGNALVGELLRAWGLDEDRRTLVRHLSAVRRVLRDAEARSSADDDVREWTNDLKLAAYRADDVLEDFHYEALRREAQIDGSAARVVATSRKVLNYFTPNCPPVFRLSMSRKLKGVLEMIDKLVNEMNKFHFFEHNEMPNTVHTHQTHAHVDVSRIVGKEAERDEVVKILFEQQDNSSVTVLPIVGMGGIGKTTLAQLVHNDERVRRHFELSIWVCVSDKKFVLADLIQSIIEVATNKRCDLSNNLEVLRKELGVVLAKKRYLLVLDDVWTEERRELEGLISLLQSHAGSGSAIVVTSRSHRVAEIMGTTRPYQISLLDENRSWELFRIKAFGSRGVDEQSELTSVAKKFVLKCGGLPLVINTMAALLGSNPDRNDWSSILDSDVIWTNAAVKQEVVPVLRLSYDHLSPELKMCFSFCAVFPKDSLLEKDMLIQLWVANSFIAPTEGQRILKELVWRCFLQVQDEDLTRGRTTCKMHDLMHDLAESITGNDCLGTKSSLGVVRHLSVDSAETSAFMKEILAPRTVLFLERRRSNKISLGMAKSQFMSLRALKAFDVDSIRRHIIYLKHLRYLDLSESEIVALPEATVMLYSLQTLKLTRCHKLKKLPEGMRYMTSLRHVFLEWCYGLERMPAGIRQLNCLETLTDYIIGSEAGHGIDELKDLNSLGGSLYLSELRNVQSPENAKLGNISSKHHLCRLGLDWRTGNIRSSRDNTELEIEEAVLEALRPPSTLQCLTVAYYNGAKWSSWMLLAHLSELELEGCNNCKNLPPLWQLPSLRRLSLEFMGSLTSICSGVDTGNGESCISQPTFPKLETVYFVGLSKLERWHEEVAGHEAVVSFPQLKNLYIIGCPMLASMPKLPLLEDLEVVESERVPLTLDLLSKFWPIPVESVGLRPLHLRFSRLHASNVKLVFSGLIENVECIEVELNLIPCTSIKGLDITDCEGLLSSEPSQILRNIRERFAFVEDLSITCCSNIVQWPAREIRNLNCLPLRSLELKNCQNLTGSFPSTSDDQIVLLSQLERLSIESCGNLLEIPELPASLGRLWVASCPKLVSLPTNPGSLPKLRELSVHNCNHLTRFLHGMEGLTTLDELSIQGCPLVETLPEGLLQRLTALELLYIDGCPNLERRCSRGGAYWDLVKAIPDLRVGWPESGPRNKCLICL